jgi:hypothetical protein
VNEKIVFGCSAPTLPSILHEVDSMSLTGFLKLLTGKPSLTGLFAYLASRDTNKSRVELEKARQEASTALISRLPNGAVFRESTTDGWREILMPPVQDPPVIALLASSAAQSEIADQNLVSIGRQSELATATTTPGQANGLLERAAICSHKSLQTGSGAPP